MKTHRLDMPMLARAEQIARAAYFKVAHRDGIACAELRILGNNFESLLAFDRGR